MNPDERVHPGIRELVPYEPGIAMDALEAKFPGRVIKLASNENPIGPSPRVREALLVELERLHRYPDGAALSLRDALAARCGCDRGQIVVGNGSNELLELALRTFVRPGETVAAAQVTFSVYGLLAQAHGARFVTAPMDGFGYDLDALAEVVRDEDARLVFLANPNNPTGAAFDEPALTRFLDRVPQRTVVLYDAAYAEYAVEHGIPDGVAQAKAYPNMITTRSFSKAYGLAGLRVGWGVGPPELIDFLQRVRQPFNVSRLAQAAARAALSDVDHLQKVVALNRRGLAQLQTGLEQLGLDVYRGYANFVLARLPVPADEVVAAMLEHGVIVRSMRGFGLPDHLRLNTGTEAENTRVLDLLAKVLPH